MNTIVKTLIALGNSKDVKTVAHIKETFIKFLMDYLRIVQHNIQSINNKKPLLNILLKDNNIDVCLLNETWLKNSSPKLNFPGYACLNKNAKN